MISVIVPVKNEEGNIESLISEIVAAAQSGVPITEIVYVDDGSTDKTPVLLKKLKEKTPMLRVFRHGRSGGQSAATWTGICRANGTLIVTMDGDGQNNPGDIAALYDTYQQAVKHNSREDILVAGQRVKRQDSAWRLFSSRFANAIRASMLDDGTRDTGCSLKLFRREDYLRLPFFNHMHRYIPALMKREGVLIRHVDVSHRARERGHSKYGTVDRLIAGLSDLLGVRWLIMRGRVKTNIEEV
jgi:dolichol-phosphate mannosyltransferase